MSERALRVLLLEQSAADAERILEALQRAALPVVADRVATEAAFVEALRQFTPDVVISDQSVCVLDAPATLEVLRTHRPGAPLIVVTGSLREEVAVACMRAGAEDVVTQENLGRLRPAIEAALRIREPLNRLSRRQLQVLRLIAEGRSTPEIARELELSVKTVETHRAELMRRLNKHDLVGLVRYAVRVGLVATRE